MITLRPFEAEDFDQLIEWSGDAAFLLQWSGPQFQYPLSREQLAEYLSTADDNDSASRYVYKAADESLNETVGHISLGGIDRYNRSGRIGKVLVGRGHQGKGYGTQMVDEVLRIGFEEQGLHRISLGVFDFNHSAIRCYEKCGFVREGLIRDARRFQDEFWNLIEMGILEDDWRRLKQDRA
ncbi:GNAT family protein [Saccharibacillus sp. CPCC 101409]|uniref:GNAT family N-acetyltransferase n=1 Tax=Saccharibacillus sp. CPCC 101409 TaxID=3058041 RepID=UPI002671CB51|nr:GNAT family protein [Saccharibacillus sp. CPCC 101409]MDO3410585.1 GNAT family protein [Saccharibacillus sp. CPCC 101409]